MLLLLNDSGLETNPMFETVVQALAEFAGIPMSEAEAALTASRGEMGAALQQQLLRVPVREEVLLEMVHEYCTLRGLPTPPKPAAFDNTADSPGMLRFVLIQFIIIGVAVCISLQILTASSHCAMHHM
jgi:hypothetical protein